MLRLAVAVLAAGVAVNAAALQTSAAFPGTKSLGRATVQYRDDRVHAVAIYDYSQRNHAAPWLLVQLGVSLSEPAVLHRGDMHLVTPDGRQVPVASQQEFLADAAYLQKFRQNSEIFRRQLQPYFPQSARADSFKLFSLPGDGIVFNEAVVLATHAVVTGDIYFKSPQDGWAAGTYRLVFDHDKGRAELPIRLD